ncbi:MAG: lysylphosphatidylglycerol synthase transmembrane domain-containing protein [Candidatus Promineifilaceae bacterium]
MQTPAWKKPQFWLGMFISAACIGAIFLFINPSKIAEALRSADIGYVISGVLLILSFMILRALRWRYMLENKIALWHIFHLQNIGYMLTQLLPFRIGDPARAVLVGNQKDLSIGQGLSTMVVERALDMMMVVLMLPVAAARLQVFPDWLRNTARVSGMLVVVFMVVVVVAANFRPKFHTLTESLLDKTPLDNKRWSGLVDDLLAGLTIFTNWRSGFMLLLLTIAIWIPIIFAYQTFMLAVHLDVNVVITIFVLCAAAFGIATPSSPGQVGVFHLAVTLSLTALGFDAAKAASFAFLYHTFNFILLITLGAIGLSRTQSTFAQVVGATRDLITQRNTRNASV